MAYDGIDGDKKQSERWVAVSRLSPGQLAQTSALSGVRPRKESRTMGMRRGEPQTKAALTQRCREKAIDVLS